MKVTIMKRLDERSNSIIVERSLQRNKTACTDNLIASVAAPSTAVISSCRFDYTWKEIFLIHIKFFRSGCTSCLLFQAYNKIFKCQFVLRYNKKHFIKCNNFPALLSWLLNDWRLIKLIGVSGSTTNIPTSAMFYIVRLFMRLLHIFIIKFKTH